MRIVFVLFVIATGCGDRVNPEFCCATVEQCSAAGESELRPCGPGQACAADNSCVAAQCETNADCDASAPVCRLGYCESTCSTDEDCAAVPGRTRCGPEATCVGCTESSQCPMDAAICDAEEHACRGCELDTECASGVCVEIEGVCADDSRVIFAGGGATSGECPRATPCRLDYALTKVRTDRDVIHLIGGMQSLPSTTISVTSQVVIDGAPTMIIGGGMPDFSIDGASGGLVLENLVLRNVRAVAGAGSIRAFNVQGQDVSLETTGGLLDIDKSEFSSISSEQPSVVCGATGTLSIVRSKFANRPVRSTTCNATVSRTMFVTDATGMLAVMNGSATVENNLFVTTSATTDMVYMIGAAGSVFRFNTVVNRSTTIDSPVAIYCDSTIEIASNIFAYNSTNPISGNGPCIVTSSLFDQQGAGDAGSNLVADHDTFFVNMAQGLPPVLGEPGHRSRCAGPGAD